MLVREMSQGRAGACNPFPHALSALMRQKGMTSAEITQATGFSPSYVEALLEGDHDPSLGVIELIAEVFAVSPRHFLEYRVHLVTSALTRDPEEANALFLGSLSDLERENVDVSSFDDRPLAEAVRALLVEEEMTQVELAESIGLSQSELSRILNGRRAAPLEFIETVAQALGVRPEFFLEYRLAMLGEWLRMHRDRVSELLERLERGVELPPYESWEVRPLPDPRSVSLVELARSIIEIIRVEGPVLGVRAYALRLRASGIWETKELRSLLNRASYAAMRARAILGVNERPERSQKFLVLRVPGTPEVRARARGDRRVAEIPLGEVRAVVKETLSYRRGEDVLAIQEEVLSAYAVPRPRLNDIEHINRAINLRSRA